jgi:hypothetical protein
VLTSPQDHWLIKGQEFEKWMEKGEKKNVGPIRGGEIIRKNFVFETKSFHKTRV